MGGPGPDTRRPVSGVGPGHRTVSPGGRRALDLLFRRGVLSQAEVTRALDLSQPTVARLIQGFERDGLVELSRRTTERPGNPSVDVRLAPGFAFSFGASLLGDLVSLSLMDFSGAVVGSRRAAMRSMSRAAVLDRLTAFHGELVAEHGVERSRVVGQGVGVSGFFVGEGGRLNPPASLDEWSLIEIAPIFEEAFGMPVTVQNAAATAAIAESLFGVGRTCPDFAYLHLTNGFGGGIVSGGRLFPGAHGNAGEFGAIWTAAGLGYPSLDRMLYLVRTAGGDYAGVEPMLATVALDTPGVDAWLAEAEHAFTMLCAFLAYALDPAAIVIGGRLPPPIAAALAARIRIPAATERRMRPPPLPAVRPAEALGDAASLGAAVMPLQAAFLA